MLPNYTNAFQEISSSFVGNYSENVLKFCRKVRDPENKVLLSPAHCYVTDFSQKWLMQIQLCLYTQLVFWSHMYLYKNYQGRHISFFLNISVTPTAISFEGDRKCSQATISCHKHDYPSTVCTQYNKLIT